MKKLNVELIDEKPKSKEEEKKVKPDGMIEMVKFVTEHGVGEDGKKMTTEEATEMVGQLDMVKEMEEDSSLKAYETQCTNCGAKNMRSRTYCWYCDADMELQKKEKEMDEGDVDEMYEEDKDYYANKISQMKEDEEAWIRWEKEQRGIVIDEEEKEVNRKAEEWREYWQKREGIIECLHGVLDMDGKWKTWRELLADNMEEDSDDKMAWKWYSRRILDMDGIWKTKKRLRRDNGLRKRKGGFKRKHGMVM